MVERRAPAAADVVREIAGALGLEVPASPTAGVGPIVEMFQRDPDAVIAAAQQVEQSDPARWEAEASIHRETQLTIRQENESGWWLTRNWRPIFAWMYGLTAPVLLGLLYHLILIDAPQTNAFVTALTLWFPSGGAVTGAYVWSRGREKIHGVAE